jgi:hypothetical protein
MLNLELTKGQTMTQTEFITLCLEHNLPPELALENDELVQALRERDDATVNRIIENEF